MLLTVELIAMLVLLGCSAFFSGSETALFSLSRDQLRAMRQAPGETESKILALLAEPRKLIVMLLLGNMIVNTMYSSIATLVALQNAHHGAHVGLAIEFALLAFLVMFGEILPKTVCLTAPRRFAALAAQPLLLFEAVVSPVQTVFSNWVKALSAPLLRGSSPTRISPDELRLLLDMSEQEGVIDEKEQLFLRGGLRIGASRVRDIMTPRVDIAMLQQHTPGPAATAVLREKKARLALLYSADPDHVVGCLYARDLLIQPEKNPSELMQGVLYVPELKNSQELMAEFLREGREFAVAVDEYGGIAGLVSLENIIHEVVGDIGAAQARDFRQAIHDLGDNRYRVSGRIGIRKWNEYLKMNLPSHEIGTLGGFVTYLLGRWPQKDDTVKYKNLVFTVLSASHHRADEILIQVSPD